MNTTQLSPLVDGEYNTSAAIDNVPIQGLWEPSYHTLLVFDTIFYIVLIGIVSVFGVMANIVNILVFYRQGPMSSSPMVVLTGLAVSDLCVSILGLSKVFFKVLEWYVGWVVFGWHVQNLYVVYSNGPTNVMIQVTCWIMVLLTVERAVSVTLPFKVKAVFTPRRSLAVVVAIFVFTIVLYIPSLTYYTPALVTVSWHPVSFREFVPSHIFPQSVHHACYVVIGVILRFSSVFLVVACNVIIAWKVKSSQRFRKSKASSTPDGASGHTQVDTQAGENKETKSKGNNPSSNAIKDRKLIRMITVVSGVFLFCFSFGIIYTIVFNLVLTMGVDYHVILANMVASVLRLLAYFNSCINAVIYFNMSARYKEELLLLCGKKTR